MRYPIIITALLALSSCGGGGTAEQANQAAPAPALKAVQTAALTGLYEGGSGEARNQLCILDRAGSDSRFGLVVWGANLHSCSGTGSAARDGDTLRLSMAGDESCAIEARIDGNGAVTLPDSLPEGCAYYCGAQASLAGADFAKVGGTAQDAARATDLVGDPLCGG